MTAASAGLKEEKCSRNDLLASEAKLSGVDHHANIVDDASLTPPASKLDHAAAANVHNGSFTDHNNTVSMNIDRNESSCQKLNGAPLVGYNLVPEKSHSNKASNQPTDDETGRQANITAKVGSGHVALVKLKKKKKKQLFTCKGASMHLSKNIFYGTFLSQQKRTKLKRAKRHALNIHPKLNEHCISEDVVPYSSDRLTSSSYGSSKHSHKSGHKSGLRERDVAAAPDNLINGFVDRQKKNFTLDIPDMQCQNNSCSLLSGEQLALQKPSVSKACLNDEVHTSGISTLTMVLDETTVGHWEVELPPGITESKGSGDFHIGHIGDEWDEEYDRGKRKKVRQSTIGFGGSNPFQEIAMTKAKLKR